MSATPSSTRRPDAVPAEVAAELEHEQTHVDRVYAELAKASRRAGEVAADGHARARSDRTGGVRDEEMTGLFERDALVFHAARRQHALDTQYEGLVFGRLDLDHDSFGHDGPGAWPGAESRREIRYVGRLGVRDDEYEPLVIDWRAPAAAPFYRATPVEPLEVIRRRVLRCRGDRVVGIEDDLMVPDPPMDLVVVGDGALMAALARSRGTRMRDIVATIQRHQDEAIRAAARGVTEITGGPGTGKTVVALHRAAYLLYSDRRRYEAGGILVVGPSAAYTAYIERVLPSLGEDSVTLRSVGDLVEAVSTGRHDAPAAAAVKGSLRMRAVLARAARDLAPDAPAELRVFVAGEAVRVDAAALDRVRVTALRQHPRNLATGAVLAALGEAAYRASQHPDRASFLERFSDHLDVETFVARWWPQVDPREVLLWLADEERISRYAAGVLDPAETEIVRRSMNEALATGTWSVADVALIDELAGRVGPVQESPAEERGFYEVDLLDDPEWHGVAPLGGLPERVGASRSPGSVVGSTDPRERLLAGRLDRPADYAHVLVDEAQDLSPMQWRAVARRGRRASWTVVGDAAQSSWGDPGEAALARAEAWSDLEHRTFHMTTNYRNAREIFDVAAQVVLAAVPDADIPEAVRESGAPVGQGVLGDDPVGSVRVAVEAMLGAVEGAVAILAPSRYAAALSVAGWDDRVQVVAPLAAKGLEWDATVVVDPDLIAAESPGGVRTLYVALTRAAHRMTVLRP
ncbi:MAG: UvrD-helicase domain-containing protein [Dermatophilaceae bacterium]